MRKYILGTLMIILLTISISFIRFTTVSSASIRKPQPISRTSNLTLLMTLPKEANLKTDPVFSQNGSKVAAIISSGKKPLFVVDGKEMHAYEDVRNLFFDRDNVLCFIGREEGQWHLVTGDKRGKGYQDILYLGRFGSADDIWWLADESGNRRYALMRNRSQVGKPIFNPETLFSRDRQHMAVYGFRDGKRVYLVDGVELNSGDSLLKGDSGDSIPYFDQNGALHFFRILATDSGKYIEFGGKSGKKYGTIDGWAVSPDGRQIAYSARKQESNGYVIVRNGEEGKPYKAVGMPRFSPDGMKLAYIVENGQVEQEQHDGDDEGTKSYSVVVNEQNQKPYAKVGKPVFSPDSTKLGYVAENSKGQSLVVINGTEGKPYDEIYDLVFSPDSRHFAFRARADARWFIVVDDQEGDSFHWVGVPTFSSDGNRLIYGARGGMSLLKDERGRILAYPIRKNGGEPYLYLQVDAHGLTYAGHKSGVRLWVTTDGWLYTSRDEDELYWVDETISTMADGSSVTTDRLDEKPRLTYVSMAKGAKSLPICITFADTNVITGGNDRFSMMTLFTAVAKESAHGKKKANKEDGEEYALVFQKFDLRESPFRSDELNDE